jgi:hypothetical protein
MQISIEVRMLSGIECHCASRQITVSNLSYTKVELKSSDSWGSSLTRVYSKHDASY